MHHAHAPIALVLGLLVTGGCLASKSSLDDGGQGVGESGGSGGTAGTSTDGPGMTSAASQGASTEDGGPRLDLPSGAAVCASVDHEGCFASVLVACGPGSEWNVDDDCAAAVADCYPIGTTLISLPDMVRSCDDEFDHLCTTSAEPGCSEDLCECTAGVYPFDWNNCWHLTTTACVFGSASDCEAVVQSCYPDTTVAEFEACYTQVTQADLPYDCNCPMCGFHEECEAELAACLAA